MQCRIIRPACFDPPQILFPKNPTPVSYGLARRCPLERSANFSGRLVAVLVQFLESLLQRPELHGAFRRPFPINIESVGRRWTGRRSLQGRQQRLHRCVVTVGGRHLHALQIGIRPNSIRWNCRVVTRWRCEFAPYSMLFGCPAGVDLVAKDGRRPRMRRLPSSLTDLYFHD